MKASERDLPMRSGDARGTEPSARKHGTRRRILILAPFPPRLDGMHGGSRALARVVRGLTEWNRVALMCLRARDEPAVDGALAAVCEWVYEGKRPGVSYSDIRPWPRALAVIPALTSGKPLWVAARWSRAFAETVWERVAGWRPDVIQAEYTVMAQYLGAERDPRARTVVTIYEPGVVAAWERVARSRSGARVLWRLDERLWMRYERRVLRTVDAAVVFTERDRAVVEQLRGTAHLERIPLGIEVPPVSADPLGGDPPELLFVGNFVHPPNLDAAVWLLEEIFPPLRARYPALRLCLVGDGAPAWLRAAADDRVVVTGRVPDLAPYLERATVVLAPLRQGGGMRVKVLEALAAGKAVVASPLAVEGLEIVHGEHALVAEGTQRITSAIGLLLDDSRQRARIAAAGRAWAAATLTPARAMTAYRSLHDRLLKVDAPDWTGEPE